MLNKNTLYGVGCVTAAATAVVGDTSAQNTGYSDTAATAAAVGDNYINKTSKTEAIYENTAEDVMNSNHSPSAAVRFA